MLEFFGIQQDTAKRQRAGPEKPLSPGKKEGSGLSKEVDVKTLGDITDSFGYIANNFANLVLKKHQAETKLAPHQAKVSQLKRKCLERDQLLAKLLLKLKTKNKSVASNNNNNSDDNSSVTSSTITRKLLVEGEKLINRVDDDDGDVTTDDECVNAADFVSPRKPNSALLGALNDSTQSVTKERPLPKHRIYVAKRDYVPMNEKASLKVTDDVRDDDDRLATSSSSRLLPSTSGTRRRLLPYLPLKAGDAVVAIGTPEKKENGKLYQLSEVRGKIGFVPSANLVAAEQVQGMQAFLEERKSNDQQQQQQQQTRQPSGTERIVDLYKSLEGASANIADKLSRSATPSGVMLSRVGGQRSRDSFDRSTISPSHSASNVGRRSNSSRRPSSGRSSRSRAAPHRDVDLFTAESSSIDRASSRDDVIDIMTSTPIPAQRHHHRHRCHRSSSEAPTKPRRSTSSGRRKKSGAPSQPRGAPSQPRGEPSQSRGEPPQPPTCPIIEKVMGKGSLCLRWLPPRMDMMSRSNDVVVIGYEICVNGVRFAQVSGAYTNQAIIGNLNLDSSTLLHIRTVSSMGSVSEAVKFVQPATSSRGGKSRGCTSRGHSDSSRSSVKTSRKATVLYDYTRHEDHQEVDLKQGQSRTSTRWPL